MSSEISLDDVNTGGGILDATASKVVDSLNDFFFVYGDIFNACGSGYVEEHVVNGESRTEFGDGDAFN